MAPNPAVSAPNYNLCDMTGEALPRKLPRLVMLQAHLSLMMACDGSPCLADALLALYNEGESLAPYLDAAEMIVAQLEEDRRTGNDGSRLFRTLLSREEIQRAESMTDEQIAERHAALAADRALWSKRFHSCYPCDASTHPEEALAFWNEHGSCLRAHPLAQQLLGQLWRYEAACDDPDYEAYLKTTTNAFEKMLSLHEQCARWYESGLRTSATRPEPGSRQAEHRGRPAIDRGPCGGRESTSQPSLHDLVQPSAGG